MSNEQITGVLSKLKKSIKKPTNNSGNSGNNGGYVDYKALNEEKKNAFTKCVPGKNNFVFLIPDGADDPFFEWTTHPGLLEKNYWTVDCDKHNKGENCLICNVVDDLRQQNKEKNLSVYKPITAKTDVYAVVVNLDNIAAGPKWLRVSKMVVDQFTVWLENLDADEQPFFSEEEPQKVIITYSPEVKDLKDKYKADKKNQKPFSEEQLAEWKSQIKPLSYWMNIGFTKSQDEIKKLVDAYLEKNLGVLDEGESNQQNDVDHTDDVDSTESETSAGVTSKLGSLRK